VRNSRETFRFNCIKPSPPQEQFRIVNPDVKIDLINKISKFVGIFCRQVRNTVQRLIIIIIMD
jgi:hypothetical protein